MRGVWLLGFPLLSSAANETINTEYCISQETPETPPRVDPVRKLSPVLCSWRYNFYNLTASSSENNSSAREEEKGDARIKTIQYKQPFNTPYEHYRFYKINETDFEEFGYCYYTFLSCPLDKSLNTRVNRILCMGNSCNKNSTIDRIFGSQREAIEMLTSDKNQQYRCLEIHEDTERNRCLSCNKTHRLEMAAGVYKELQGCRIYPDLYLENPSEHTLTYLILVILLVIVVAVYFLHMFFLQRRYPDPPIVDDNQMEDVEREPLVTDEVKIYMDCIYVAVNEHFPNDLEKDESGITGNFRISGSKLGSKHKFMRSLLEAQKIQKISYFSTWIYSEEFSVLTTSHRE